MSKHFRSKEGPLYGRSIGNEWKLKVGRDESEVANRRDADDRQEVPQITLYNSCSHKKLKQVLWMHSLSHLS